MSKLFTEDQMKLIKAKMKSMTMEKIINGYEDLATEGSDDFKQGYDDVSAQMYEFYVDEFNKAAREHNELLKTVPIPTVTVPSIMRAKLVVAVLNDLVNHHMSIKLIKLEEDSYEYYEGEKKFLNESLASMVQIHNKITDEYNELVDEENKKKKH